MKMTAKIMEFVGVFLLFIGGGSIGEYTLVPMAMAFTGMAIAAAGMSLDEALGKERHG